MSDIVKSAGILTRRRRERTVIASRQGKLTATERITEQLGELRGRLSNLEAAKDIHTPLEANPDQAARQLASEAPPALTDRVRARVAELRFLSDSDSDIILE